MLTFTSATLFEVWLTQASVSRHTRPRIHRALSLTYPHTWLPYVALGSRSCNAVLLGRRVIETMANRSEQWDLILSFISIWPFERDWTSLPLTNMFAVPTRSWHKEIKIQRLWGPSDLATTYAGASRIWRSSSSCNGFQNNKISITLTSGDSIIGLANLLASWAPSDS